MNISELSAKIKITVEQQELTKLNDALEEVKKKIKEFSKHVEESQDKQKQSGQQTEKVAEKTEKAAKSTEKQAKATKELADKTKHATSEAHSFLGIIERLTKALIKMLAVGVGGVGLERMYEKAGKLGASLRLMSTDFGMKPETLQRWQAMAESAGSSSDAMNRILSTVTEMRREAIINPFAMPDALNIAGIRPAVYQNDEALLNAILRAASKFTDERKRLAWFKAAGFGDVADLNFLMKEWQKGGGVNSQYLISDENVEKLTKVNAALSRFNRLATAIKSNFLAAISDTFVEQIEKISQWIILSAETIEKFIARHGGLKKVLGDAGGILSRITNVANGLAAIAKIVMQFGAFTSLILGFGLALGVVLKIVDLIVGSFTKAVGLVGSLKELMFGFMAMKIEEAIQTGAIPEEYLPEAKKARDLFKEGAGVYQDPKAVAKGLSDILAWLYSIPSKIADALSSVFTNVLMKGMDYLIDQILTMWANSDLPFNDWARSVLFNRYIVRGDRTPEQTEFVKDYIRGIQNETQETVTTGEARRYYRSGSGTLGTATKEESVAISIADTLRTLTNYGRNLHNLSKDDAFRVQDLLNTYEKGGYADFARMNDKQFVQTVNQTFNFSEYTKDLNLGSKVGNAASKGAGQGFKQAQVDTAGVM